MGEIKRYVKKLNYRGGFNMARRDEILQKISDIIGEIKELSELPQNLREEIEKDKELKQLFLEYKKLDQLMKGWNVELPPKQYWDSFNERLIDKISQELENFPEIDPLAPPFPEDHSELSLRNKEKRLSLEEIVAGTYTPTLSPSYKTTSEDSGLLNLKELIPEKLEVKVDEVDEVKESQVLQPVFKKEKPISWATKFSYAVIGILVIIVVGLVIKMRVIKEEEMSKVGVEPKSPVTELKVKEIAAVEHPTIREEKREVLEGRIEEKGEAFLKETEIGKATSMVTEQEERRRQEKRLIQPQKKTKYAVSSALEMMLEGESGGRATPATKEKERSTAFSQPPQKEEGKKVSSLDALLLSATKGTIETTPTEEELPLKPSINDVKKTMNPIAAKVKGECSKFVEKPLLVVANITVANNGKVEKVVASGGSPEANKCVEDIVMTAKFPRFKEATFNLNYAFNLRPPEDQTQ